MGKKNKDTMSSLNMSLVTKVSIGDDYVSKKSKKKEKTYNGKYPKEMIDKYYQCLAGYAHVVLDLGILTDLAPQQYKDAAKTLKKLVKKLKNGDVEDVFDEDRVAEWLSWKEDSDE